MYTLSCVVSNYADTRGLDLYSGFKCVCTYRNRIEWLSGTTLGYEEMSFGDSYIADSSYRGESFFYFGACHFNFLHFVTVKAQPEKESQ